MTGVQTCALPIYPAFDADYSGNHSLPPGGQIRETLSIDLMAGVRLWPGAEVHADGLMWQGFGVGSALGLGGFSNGEAFKVGTQVPNVNLARLFLRQTVGLGDARETVEDGDFQLPGERPASRLTFTVGKFSPKDIFDANMPTPNQIHVSRSEVKVTAADLMKIPEGQITDAGLKMNVDVGIQYLESWMRGSGCVPIYNLMEDAATAEISRTQVWQWLHFGKTLADGRKVTAELVRQTIQEQLAKIRTNIGDARFNAGKFPQAAELFEQMMLSPDCKDFLTLEAYRYL